MTGIGCVAAGCSLLGAACYNLFAKTWTYRSLLTSSSLAYALANGLSVLAYKRINIKYGIPDPIFMLASNALQTVLGQLSWMPMTVMLAQLVPSGLESVMHLALRSLRDDKDVLLTGGPFRSSGDPQWTPSTLFKNTLTPKP